MDSLIDDYNNTPHRGIGFQKPNSINSKKKEKLLLKTIYNRPKKFLESKFKVGDYVRQGDHKRVFDKGYEPNFSTAIFIVPKIKVTNPVTYIVKDKESNIELKRSYYDHEFVVFSFSYSLTMFEAFLEECKKVGTNDDCSKQLLTQLKQQIRKLNLLLKTTSFIGSANERKHIQYQLNNLQKYKDIFSSKSSKKETRKTVLWSDVASAFRHR